MCLDLTGFDNSSTLFIGVLVFPNVRWGMPGDKGPRPHRAPFLSLLLDDGTYFMIVRAVQVTPQHVNQNCVWERPHPFLLVRGCDCTQAERHKDIAPSHSYIKSAAQWERGKTYFLGYYFPKEMAVIFVICEIHLFISRRWASDPAVFLQYLINWGNYPPLVVLGFAVSGFSQ